jgi:squalene-hopene/tetraprenyl-beta-curcumene cyclase
MHPGLRPESTEANAPSGSATAAAILVLLGRPGAKPDDAPIRAAGEWLGRHYTLEQNPGANSVDLPEYYFLLASTYQVLGSTKLVRPDGRQIDGVRKLAEKLINLQNGNGSYPDGHVGAQPRNPVLATSYCLFALETIYGLL